MTRKGIMQRSASARKRSPSDRSPKDESKKRQTHTKAAAGRKNSNTLRVKQQTTSWISKKSPRKTSKDIPPPIQNKQKKEKAGRSPLSKVNVLGSVQDQVGVRKSSRVQQAAAAHFKSQKEEKQSPVKRNSRLTGSSRESWVSKVGRATASPKAHNAAASAAEAAPVLRTTRANSKLNQTQSKNSRAQPDPLQFKTKIEAKSKRMKSPSSKATPPTCRSRSPPSYSCKKRRREMLEDDGMDEQDEDFLPDKPSKRRRISQGTLEADRKLKAPASVSLIETGQKVKVKAITKSQDAKKLQLRSSTVLERTSGEKESSTAPTINDKMMAPSNIKSSANIMNNAKTDSTTEEDANSPDKAGGITARAPIPTAAASKDKDDLAGPCKDDDKKLQQKPSVNEEKYLEDEIRRLIQYLQLHEEAEAQSICQDEAKFKTIIESVRDFLKAEQTIAVAPEYVYTKIKVQTTGQKRFYFVEASLIEEPDQKLMHIFTVLDDKETLKRRNQITNSKLPSNCDEITKDKLDERAKLLPVLQISNIQHFKCGKVVLKDPQEQPYISTRNCKQDQHYGLPRCKRPNWSPGASLKRKQKQKTTPCSKVLKDLEKSALRSKSKDSKNKSSLRKKKQQQESKASRSGKRNPISDDEIDAVMDRDTYGIDELPSFQFKKTVTESQQDSESWGGAKSQQLKAASNNQDRVSPRKYHSNAKLPPNVQTFIADYKSVNFHGDKLAEIKENDMVCKLVYGHLNRVVQVNKKDFQFLKPGVYLNDILILFYLRFLQYYVIPKPLETKVHIFDPQFFTKLQESPKHLSSKQSQACGEERYSVSHGYKGVKRWTKKSDIFQKEYILVPICQDQHWTLAIICRANLIAEEMLAHINHCKEEAKMAEASSGDENSNCYGDDDEQLLNDNSTLQHHSSTTALLMGKEMPLIGVAKGCSTLTTVTTTKPPRNVMTAGGENNFDHNVEMMATDEVNNHQILNVSSSLAARDDHINMIDSSENYNHHHHHHIHHQGVNEEVDSQPRKPLKGGGGGDCLSNDDANMAEYDNQSDQDEEEDSDGDREFVGQFPVEDDSDQGLDDEVDGEEELVTPNERLHHQNLTSSSNRMLPVFNNESEQFEDEDGQEDDEDELGSSLTLQQQMGMHQPHELSRNMIYCDPMSSQYFTRLARKEQHTMPKEACKDKPFILFMDSLHADSVDEMMQHLREYLELEFIEKKVQPAERKYFYDPAYKWTPFNFERVPHYQPKLPKQQNFTDCGLFVLQYAETFLLNPSFILNDLHQSEGTLFHRRIVGSKRDEIMRIIIAIAEETVSIEQIGEVYWAQLEQMQGRKTHFKRSNGVANAAKDPSLSMPEEESKLSNSILQSMELAHPPSGMPLDLPSQENYGGIMEGSPGKVRTGAMEERKVDGQQMAAAARTEAAATSAMALNHHEQQSSKSCKLAAARPPHPTYHAYYHSIPQQNGSGKGGPNTNYYHNSNNSNFLTGSKHHREQKATGSHQQQQQQQQEEPDASSKMICQ